MEAMAKRLQSLDVTLTYRIQQLELKSFVYNERISTLEGEASKKESTSKEMADILTTDPEQVASKHKISRNPEKTISILEKLEAFDKRLTNIAKICSENTRKIIKLEVESGHFRQKISKKEQVPSKTGKFSKLRSKGYHFFSTISIPGISRIFTTDISVCRVLWTILVLTSLSFGFYNIAESVDDYYKFDVITNIERITPDEVTYPAITICTRDIFYKDYYYKNGTRTGRRENTSDLDLSNFIRAYGSANYELIAFSSYKCLRLNGDTNRVLKASNGSGGIFSSLNLTHQEVISENEYILYSFYDFNFQLFIADNYLKSYLMSPESESFSLKAHKDNLIKIEKTDIETKLPKPFNNCTYLDPETGEKNYRQLNCIEMCINRETKFKRNCSLSSYYYGIKNLTRCSDSVAKLSNEFFYKCKQTCPSQCEYTRYSIQLIEYDMSDLKQFTNFDFSFSDLSSIKITQLPKMNEFTFISNIGGALGLFMGISFLNFIEIFEFIIELFLLIFFL